MKRLIVGPLDCEETKESLENFESSLFFYEAEVRLEDGRPFEVYDGSGRICVYLKNPDNSLEVKRFLKEHGFNSKNCKLYVRRH
jgi:hypothetical protein